MLKKPKRPQQVEVICDCREDPIPFPAVRIKYRGAEWIVKPEELMTLEEWEKEKEEQERLKILTGKNGKHHERPPF